MAVAGRLELSVRAVARSEAALVRAAKAGDADAVAELFRRHWRGTYRAAYLVVGNAAAAEDIAQEAFLRAIDALDRFDRRRPMAPWLHRIAVNRAIDWTRARRPDAPDGATQAAPPPDSGLSDDVVAALAGLPADRRAVVVLRYLLEYTPGEIATMLDLPRGTVNSRLRRGLDELKRSLAP
jgi:RNA polymerase sigma-70 factor (ECF subfamily)